jgi:diadenosine tetraphosphate (Ap4A) HIT family hydrolase
MTKSIFSKIPESEWLHKSSHFYIVQDKHPVNDGHLLIISKKQRRDFFEFAVDEQKELTEAIMKSKELIEKYHNPTGYNIGMNCGSFAGQTVFHFHCHVIPRYDGDMADPRGGVRHCVKGKGYY